jgi:hypothetical protein
MGAPPFEDRGGVATTDPGASATVTLTLDPGTYVLYCLLPSPDGVTHAARGMVQQVTVTEGPGDPLPAASGTITATDFAFDRLPSLEPGTATIRLRNRAGQLHELNLVELTAAGTIDDVVDWYRRHEGPPPMRSLGGVVVPAAGEANATFDLEQGATYAFVCAIPDMSGDFAPHLTKGMVTAAFTAR